MLKKITLLFSLVLMSVQLCLAQKNDEIKNQPPKPLREFRAAWIATVANINWPSKPGLTSAEQQKEAIALLDLLKSLNFSLCSRF